MTRRRAPSWEYDQRRNARIRRLRDEREGPVRRRRRIQPLLLLLWLAGTIALLGVLLFVGFATIFAPRAMAWVEENPGAIEHGIVRDFVEWYRPGALADEPASDQRQRITIDIQSGANDTQIGEQLSESGVISSRLAFQYAVVQAGREGTLAAGAYDLSPTLRPSEIVAILRGQPFGEVASVTILEGVRLEQIVATFGESELTMNLEAFASILEAPPADLVNQFDFLADLSAARSLEGYILPETLEYEVTGEESTPRAVVTKLLEQFETALTQEIRDGIATQGLSIDEAVIIASLVEREAVIEEERLLIAAVYVNRYLQTDNPQTVGLLNADPTLQYAQATFAYRLTQQLPVDQWGTVEWWPGLQASGDEIGADWPPELAGYQTYLNPGLPPTPIAAPRIESIAAVANADTADGFLFFVAGCPNGVRDGSHYFTDDYGEHLANVDRAQQECAGL